MLRLFYMYKITRCTGEGK